jgi:hypothetical protein
VADNFGLKIGIEGEKEFIMGFRYAPSHYIPAQKPQIVREKCVK